MLQYQTYQQPIRKALNYAYLENIYIYPNPRLEIERVTVYLPACSPHKELKALKVVLCFGLCVRVSCSSSCRKRSSSRLRHPAWNHLHAICLALQNIARPRCWPHVLPFPNAEQNCRKEWDIKVCAATLCKTVWQSGNAHFDGLKFESQIFGQKLLLQSIKWKPSLP